MTGRRAGEPQVEQSPPSIWGLLPEQTVAMIIIGTMVALGILVFLVAIEIVNMGITEASQTLRIGLTALLSASVLCLFSCVAVFVVVDFVRE